MGCDLAIGRRSATLWRWACAPIFAAASLARLAAANDDKPRPAAPGPTVVAAPAQKAATFTLRIVGPDGKPVPEAKVEVRSTPLIQATQIHRGKFLHRMRYAASATADAEGRLVFDRPADLKRLNLYVKIPGYAPYWAGWSGDDNSEPIPAELTVKLEAAWTVGGIVVDSDDKPIPNVRVAPWIEFTKRPGDSRQMGTGDRVWTNSKGEWTYESAPLSLNAVPVEIYDPNFMSQQLTLSRALYQVERGHRPTAKMILNRGLTVTGRVTDENGKPIAKATVWTRFGNNDHSAVTDAQGVYRLEGCEPGQIRLVAAAKGRARTLQDVAIARGMTTVDFQMQPGATLRVRVLDEHGKPIPKARIFFQQWHGRIRYFEFEHVPQFTDEHGLWEWKEAPVDPVQADICRPDGMQLSDRPLVPGEKEHVFRVPPALVISGKVVDAETKQPIKSFRVIPGIRWANRQAYWNANEAFNSTEGHYRFREEYEQPAFQVRVEADGHLPGVSRQIKSDEGNVTIDFALARGQDLATTVVTADGAPAPRAKVALLGAGAHLTLQNGDFAAGQIPHARQDADEAGRVRFGPQTSEFWLVAVHPSGYAQLKCSPSSIPKTLQLTRWARVEGTYRVARKPQANAKIWISHQGNARFVGPNGASIYLDYNQTTDASGHFAFDQVIPGQGSIGRFILIMMNEGTSEMTSSTMVPVKFTAGETTHVDLGVSGRPVIGQLQTANGEKPAVGWNFVLVEFAGNGRNFQATVDPQGNFCIDDVPPGEYSLSLQFLKGRQSRFDPQRFTVTGVNQKLLQRPVDLGVLTLDRANR
jgi:protocatechuate 3,4-dioxygenase beta subunit